MSKQEQEELLTQLEDYVVLDSQGKVCCHCVCTDVVRNGKTKGVKRYLCRGCNKSFSDLTNSAT